MSAPQFTPGPWSIEPMGNYQLKVAGPLLPAGGRTMRIANIGSPRVYRNDELDARNEANARLIAAAPDLYNAVAALLEAMKSTGPIYEEFAALRVALAKAKGEA